MKKILIVCQHYWPESFRINDIADYLTEKDCEIDVLCGIPNYPKGEFYKGYSIFKNRKQIHRGVNIKRVIEVPRGNNSNVRIFINYISFPLASIFHVPRLLTKKYDKILIYQLSPVMMAIAGIAVGKIKRTETTMAVLDLWPENLFSVLEIKNKFFHFAVTKISHWHYRKVDKLIALSDKMKDRLIEITGKSTEEIIVLPQACEKLYENPLKDKKLTNKFGKSFNIVFTGNISPAQSINTMLDAAEILNSRKLSNIKWIIVGDGMSRPELEDEIIKRNLTKSFSLEGHHPIGDIPKYTNIADILIGCLVKSPLLEATIPAKVMSYIASGKPIVLAMDGEVQDLINNKIKCGFAGPTEDAKTLADNIEKVYLLPKNSRLELGKNAREYHFNHFERGLILGKLHDFIFDSTRV